MIPMQASSEMNLDYYLDSHPEYVARLNIVKEHFEICWFVCNVDEIYEEYKAKEVNIISELAPKPWGMREFTIQDPNGYHIRIGEGTDDKAEY